MKLGAFSVSLNVKNLELSKIFYEKLGFSVLGGDLENNYLIMKNDDSVIGLFQGMFEHNILTFNPGFDMEAGTLESFEDVREIEQAIKEKGIDLISEVEKDSTGPGSMMFHDPDGNIILIDQHV